MYMLYSHNDSHCCLKIATLWECARHFLDIYLFATHTITVITKKYTKKRNVGRNGEEA